MAMVVLKIGVSPPIAAMALLWICERGRNATMATRSTVTDAITIVVVNNR